MYKTLSALGVILILVLYSIVTFGTMLPKPVSNVVLAEKGDGIIMGGQAAVAVPANLTNAQHAILKMAYDIAKADGHKNPELVQGVILQESHAGGLKSYKVAGNRGDEYYGIGQIKVGAARDVMTTYPHLWKEYKFHTKTDDELIANLILNYRFNIEITSKYLKLLSTRYGFTGRQLVNAYNRGPGGVRSVDDNYHYALDVESKLRAMKR